REPRRVRIEGDLAPRHLESHPRDPVRPRVKKRNPHRPAIGRVRAQAVALAEQLIAVVANRATDHSGGGDERGLDAPLVFGPKGQRGEIVDGALADHPETPWGTAIARLVCRPELAFVGPPSAHACCPTTRPEGKRLLGR